VRVATTGTKSNTRSLMTRSATSLPGHITPLAFLLLSVLPAQHQTVGAKRTTGNLQCCYALT